MKTSPHKGWVKEGFNLYMTEKVQHMKWAYTYAWKQAEQTKSPLWVAAKNLTLEASLTGGTIMVLSTPATEEQCSKFLAQYAEAVKAITIAKAG